jgi:pimeloyl-ACP methyl ester carboxylesterase
VRHLLHALGILAGAAALVSCATTPAQPVAFAGAPCVRPPPMHCPDKDCPGEMVTNQGSVVEPGTNRSYFLDYPCDLKRGEDVTLILALHGGGSYGNWQRNYFPAMDYADKRRLVIATPNTRGWSAADDPYLQNIVTGILKTIGKENVKSFWLVGHSMGSFNSRRLVCTDFFRDKVDGYLSLSGGRVGNPPGSPAPQFNIPPLNGSGGRAGFQVGGPSGSGGPSAGARPPGAAGAAPGGPGGGPGGAIAAAQNASLDCDFSFIFANGEHEPSAQTLAATSSWAEKYGCRPRETVQEITDVKAGYVYDSSRQEFGTDAWGRLPRGGSAEVMEYRNCRDGRIVADVMRKGKGHTEGLEPRVTEKLIDMMQRARGGKLRSNAGGQS